MDNKLIYVIIIAVAIVVAAGILAYGMMNSNHEKVIKVNNTTGNNSSSTSTSSVNATPVNHEEVSSSKQVSNKYKSGLSDSEIEAYIERDLAVREANGVNTPYDMDQARSFYENVPPTGMGD